MSVYEKARRAFIGVSRKAERLRRPRRPRCPFCERPIYPDEGRVTINRRRYHAECAEMVVRRLLAPPR